VLSWSELIAPAKIVSRFFVGNQRLLVAAKERKVMQRKLRGL
jgi:hypothetical protein